MSSLRSLLRLRRVFEGAGEHRIDMFHVFSLAYSLYIGPGTYKNPDLSSYIWALALGKNPSYLIYGHETCFYCRDLDGNFIPLAHTPFSQSLNLGRSLEFLLSPRACMKETKESQLAPSDWNFSKSKSIYRGDNPNTSHLASLGASPTGCISKEEEAWNFSKSQGLYGGEKIKIFPSPRVEEEARD